MKDRRVDAPETPAPTRADGHRDAQCFLQIVHLGALDVVAPARLAEARSALRVAAHRGDTLPPDAANSRPSALDAFAWAALREWLERVTAGELRRRHVPTLLVETGARTRWGDRQSHTFARDRVRHFSEGLVDQRWVIAGASDLACGEQHSTAVERANSLWAQREPLGQWTVQVVIVDSELQANLHTQETLTATLDEHAPVVSPRVLAVIASHRGVALLADRPDTQQVTLSTASPHGVVRLLRFFAMKSAPKCCLLEVLSFERRYGLGAFRMLADGHEERLFHW
ncbi:MAG: hypothetical protein Q8Q09_23555 [Deltaproteobacteria bacterium]|nr:hypothetical protein [Deltaproteobacteria bacterium]